MPSLKRVGGKVQLEVESLDEGLDTAAGPNNVDPKGSPDCLNVVFDSYGSVATRNGASYFNPTLITSAPIDGLANYNQTMLAWAGGNLLRASGTTFVTVPSAQSQFASGANVAWTVYQNVLFCSDGTNGPYRYEGGSDFYRMGIGIPSAPVAASNVATSTGNGPEGATYLYRVSYLTTHVVEGQYGTVSNAVTIASTATIGLTGIPTAPASYGVAQRFIYRASSTASSTYRYIGTLANNTATTFTDTVGATTWAVGATPVTDGTAPTPFTTIKLHKDRLFFDDSSDRTILRYTEHRNPYVSKANDFINMDKGDGASITAIGVQDDLVSVFKLNSIWVVNIDTPGDDTTWAWQKTPGNLGIVGPKAFAEIQNAIFFLGRRNGKVSGFHILSGLTLTDSQDTRLRSDVVSNRIRPDILALNSALWSDAAIGTFNNAIFCAVAKSSDTQNAHIYWLDMNRVTQSGEIGSWSLWDGLAAKVKQFVQVNGKFYAGSSSSDGFVLELEKSGQYNDCGGAINSYWWSKLLGGEGEIESWIKDFRYLSLWYYLLGNWSMRVNYRLDGDVGDGNAFDVNLNPGGSLWGTMIWGSGEWGGARSNVENEFTLGNSLGRKIQIRFSNKNTVDAAFKVHSLKVLMNLRRDRQILSMGS